MIIARLPIKTPKAAMAEMMLMALLFFGENKYRFAIEKGTFTWLNLEVFG